MLKLFFLILSFALSPMAFSDSESPVFFRNPCEDLARILSGFKKDFRSPIAVSFAQQLRSIVQLSGQPEDMQRSILWGRAPVEVFHLGILTSLVSELLTSPFEQAPLHVASLFDRVHKLLSESSQRPGDFDKRLNKLVCSIKSVLRETAISKRLMIAKSLRFEDFSIEDHAQIITARFDLRLSLLIDTLIDMNVRAINLLNRGHAKPTHSHMGPAAWSDREYGSSYLFLNEALKQGGLSEGQHVVDVGSGFGRLGVLIGIWFPHLKFSGFEINPIKVSESQEVKSRLGLTNIFFYEQDLTAPGFQFPRDVDVFYLFSPLNDESLPVVLDKMRVVATLRPIKVIALEGDGHLLPTLRAVEWLTPKGKINMSHIAHDGLIFESRPSVTK